MNNLLQEYECASGNKQTTRKTYHSVWTKFNKFLLRLDVMPSTWERRVAVYCAYLIDQGLQSSTLKSYVSAIKSVLKSIQYPWQDSKLYMEALTRICSSENDIVTTRLAIGKNLLNLIIYELIRMFEQNNQPYLLELYKMIFLLAYYGLLRISELTKTVSGHAVKAKDVHVGYNKDKILLILYTSKTHSRKSKPQQVKITALESHTNKNLFCPFKTIRKFTAIRGHTYIDDSENFFIFSDDRPVSAMHVRTILKTVLTQLGLDPKFYGTHSFRIGRTTDLEKAGQNIEK